MKTILVLTDLTENAAHAAKSAVIFAAALNTDILLYNTKLTMPVSTYYADYAGGPWVAEDIVQWKKENTEKLNHLAAALQPIIARLDPMLYKPVVHCKCEECELTENIADIIRQKNVELIVMGASSGSTFEHILSGSDTKSVINHATCPIFVVPEHSDFKKLKKVVFATDFNEADIKGIDYLAKLGKVFNFQIEIVHVSLFGTKDSAESEKEKIFLKQVSKSRYSPITFKEIKGDNVVLRLNDLCNDDDADLLTLVHYQRSFLVRLVHHSTTKEALHNQNIPLLIFPSKMDSE